MSGIAHAVRKRLAKMYLIIALCLFCGWAAPITCRSVDINDPSEDLEPFVAHHHHEGNIAELLIPLLERSLAQSEARSNERQHRRNKHGKKVIQMLPYEGSEEHKRKGWRKLNSHKKQVVEITPLHGKNRAKPLAYILSAAKSNHGEHNDNIDDISSASTSDLEYNKSTSEEQQSSEEDENINTLRTGDGLDFPSVSSNTKSKFSEENEDINVNTFRTGDDFDSDDDVKSSEVVISKDVSGSDKEYSGDMTAESVDDSADESEAEIKVVDESEEESNYKSGNKHKHHSHQYKSTLRSAENEAVIEDEDLKVDDEPVTAEDAENLKSVNKHTHTNHYKDTLGRAENKAVSLEDEDLTMDNKPVIAKNAEDIEDAVVNVENRDATAESIDDSVEDKYVTLGNLEPILENAVEYRAATADLGDTLEDDDVIVEIVPETVENGLLAVEDEPITLEENKTSESKTADDKTASTGEDTNQKTAERISNTNTDDTFENDDVTVNNDVIVERAATEEDSDMYTQPSQNHFHQNNDISNIKHLVENYGAHKDDDFVEDSDFIGDDIIITRVNNDLVDESTSRIFNDDATDIIEIQSSDETSKDAHNDCLESEKHHDHKSYRLSFTFNK